MWYTPQGQAANNLADGPANLTWSQCEQSYNWANNGNGAFTPWDGAVGLASLAEGASPYRCRLSNRFANGVD